MHWPTSIKEVQKLPEVDSDLIKDEFPVLPHNDEIIDIITSNLPNFPYVLITFRSIYIYDNRHKTCINIHIRSLKSIELYGSNKSIKISPNQQTFAIKTDKNVILIYIIKFKGGSDSEVLNIYSKTGNLIQNGYPITTYIEDDLVFGGIDSKFVQSNNFKNGKNVINLINSFMSADLNEIPNKDLGLRLKLILNVASPIVEYCFINNLELMLINNKPHAFQIIHLNNSNNHSNNTDNDNNDKNNNNNNTNNNEINFIIADELDWFKDPEINNNSDILGMEYNYDLDCFLWFNQENNLLLVKKINTNSTDLELNGKLVYKSNNSNNKIIKSIINHFKNLIYILFEDGEIKILKLLDNFTCRLLKIIKKCTPSNKPKDLILSSNGDSLVVLFENGWNIYSILGNLNFSTFEFELDLDFKINKENNKNNNKQKVTNFINLKKFKFLNNFEIILVNYENEIILINLLNFNLNEGFNYLNFKRPLLIDNDKIFIFKAYEKKIYEYHHYNYNLNDITNKETDIWLKEMIPQKFKIHNTIIRSTCISEDGNKICIVGNFDVIVFDNFNKKWSYLENLQDNKSFEKIEIPIRKCLFWKNYLILGSFNDINNDNNNNHNDKENKRKSEIIIFNDKIFNGDFNFDNIIWGFNFNESKTDEIFLNFNIDLNTNELFVITDKLNLYSWKLKIKIELKDKIKGDYINNNEGNLIEDLSITCKKSEILIIKSKIFQIQSCFKKNDDSIILNYGTILKINENDLLFLTNTDLYYIKSENNEFNTYLISNQIEYVYKLNNSLICLFDGSQLIHYNLNDDKNLLNLKPIKINIGNEIIKNEINGDKIIKYNGVCPYPITTIVNQNIYFGIDIENLNMMKMNTIKSNYLGDLLTHYIISNIEVKDLEYDSNALSLNTVYNKFSKFKNYKFIVEKLMVEYLQKCYDKENYDINNEYFNRLDKLIELSNNYYEILLNVLKKIEIQFWVIYFKKSGQEPRNIVNKLFNQYEDYKLSAHFFIIMLNYENNEDSRNKSCISKEDQELIFNIIKKLILSKDFETSFELFRFLKIVDDKMTHECLVSMKKYLRMDTV